MDVRLEAAFIVEKFNTDETDLKTLYGIVMNDESVPLNVRLQAATELLKVHGRGFQGYGGADQQ